MSDRYIVIEGWERFQHRDAARSVVPTWIKVYTELMSNDEWLDLSFHLRGVLISVWVEYALSRRQLRASPQSLRRRFGHTVKMRDLEALRDAGFITFSASKPASDYASNHASLEKRREEKNKHTNKDHLEVNGGNPLIDQPLLEVIQTGDVLREI